MSKKNKNKQIKRKNANYKVFFLLIVVFNIFIAGKVFAAEISPAVVIELVNEARNKQNIQDLVENAKLDRAAEEKANDMLANDYFAHTSPQGVTPWQWIEKNDYDYKYAGENLAINFTDPIEQQAAWMNSQSHKKNILNSKYIEIGVAVVRGKINGHFSTITVQEFGTLIDAKNAPVAISGQIKKQEEPKVLAATFVSSKNIFYFSFSRENMLLTFWILLVTSFSTLVVYEFLISTKKRRLMTVPILTELIK